ncbi:MAG: hypothetical protein F4X57_10505 [Chloroflexi bacterium]|nr:hypothetical protein [Chloroflexota bacterium]
MGVAKMSHREITHSLVEIIHYSYLHPADEGKDAVYAFTHSQEINNICADILPPYAVTPVDKETLKNAMSAYAQRRNISTEDEAQIRAWLDNMPEEVAIIEREP